MRRSLLVLRGLLRPVNATRTSVRGRSEPRYSRGSSRFVGTLGPDVNVAEACPRHEGAPDTVSCYAPFDIFELGAYPPYSSAAEAHLSRRLRRLEGLPNGYDYFVLCWKCESAAFAQGAKEHQTWQSFPKPGMLANFQFIKAAVPISDAEKSEEYLTNMLGNAADKSSMRLVEREGPLNQVARFVTKYLSSATNKKGMMTLFSTSGSGKTQLLKCALHSCAATPVARGYVLVCECGATSMYFDEMQKFTLSDRTERDIDKFLISIIQRHVTAHVGAELGVMADATVDDAFAAWRAACGGEEYRPIIVFDAIEKLPQMTSIFSKSIVRTILEAVVNRLPAGHGVVAFGTRHISTGELSGATDVELVRMDRLPCLTLAGYSEAVGVWRSLQ